MAENENNLSQKTVLGILTAKILGHGLAYSTTSDGIAKIIAGRNGVFIADDERISKFNYRSKHVTLNTIRPYSNVTAGEVIALLGLSKDLYSRNELDELIFSLQGNAALLSVTTPDIKTAALLHTDTDNSTPHLTRTVKRLLKEFPNVSFDREYSANHNVDDITTTLENAACLNEELVFIIKGINEHTDILQAVKNVADEIICDYVPEVYLSDMVVATKKDKRAIVIPYRYGELSGQTLNQYIQKFIHNDKISHKDFISQQNVVLAKSQKLTEEEMSNIVSSSNSSEQKDSSNIAAVVLAAGPSSRTGKNKLLADINGKPLILKTLENVIKSKASPVYIITGHQNAELEDAIKSLDVNIIYNPNYITGIKTSIKLGLDSVPSSCSAAILIPADMPNVSDKFINKMIDAYDNTKEKQVITAGLKKIKKNPIIWSRALFPVADLIPENSDIRPSIVEYSDYTTIVNTNKEELLIDINFPNDINKLASS